MPHLAARVSLPATLCALSLLVSAAPASAQSGGPDAFGTVYAPMTLAYASLASTGVNLNLADDAETTVSLPFTFPFYGTTTTQIRVGENGALLTGATGEIAYTNACFPTTTQPPDIAVY